MKTKLNIRSGFKRGFSLVEMLVVIMVIGIMAAIAIPLIVNVLNSSKEASAQRNAQSVATLATQAYHAGNTTLGEVDTIPDALNLLAEGVTGAGDFESVLFRLPLSTAERQRLLPYLAYNSEGFLIVSSVP